MTDDRLPGQESALLRNILDAIEEAVVVGDPAFKIILWSSGAEQVYGWKAEEVIGKPAQEVIRSKMTDAERRSLYGRLRNGEDVTGEFVQLRKDGSEILVSGYNARLTDEDGNITGFVAINHDITAERWTVEELRHSQDKFSLIYEKVPVAIALCSFPDGIIVDVNPAFERLFSYRSDEVVGKTTIELGVSQSVEARARIVAELRKRGRVRDREVNLTNKMGEQRAFSLNIDVVEMDGKKYILQTALDITDRIRAQEYLKQKDQAIREAYTEVLAAITGGKLVLMTTDEIRQELGEPVSESFEIGSAADLGDARRQIQSWWRENFAAEIPRRAPLIVTEALSNAVKHAGRGNYQFYLSDATAQIRVTDDGPGIQFSHLTKATLAPGFSTTATLGLGFTIMLNESDRLLLATEPGETTVVLEIGA